MPDVFERARLTLKLYHPATFLERGVALPFTTPLLAGARARPAGHHQLELIVPSPSGGRGVYIMPWAAVSAFCRPTLHDMIFRERIASLPFVTPQIIRAVGREIAAEGLAGEDAADAARMALEAEKTELVLANFQLLLGLHAQVSANPAAVGRTHFESSPDRAERLRQAVDVTAAFLGQSADWIVTSLEQIAELMAPIGVQESQPPHRLRRQVALLTQVRGDIRNWTKERRDELQVSQGQTIYRVAELTLELVENAIGVARQIAADAVGLLRAWAKDRQAIGQILIRPEWLLDGWEQICLLWNDATDDIGRALILPEVADLVPVMPKEVARWGGDEIATADQPAWRRRIVPFNEDWLTGAAVFGLIARNENLRAASC